MGSEVYVVVSESFCCNECSVYVHGLYHLAKSSGYVELICVSLRRTYEDNAYQVNVVIVNCFVNQRLSPVMSGHFLRSRSDACQCVDAAIHNLERVSCYRNVTEVYVRLSSEYANWLCREQEVIVHSALAHDFLNDNDFLLSRSSNLLHCLSLHDLLVCEILLHSVSDLLSYVVNCSMNSDRSRSLHVLLVVDHGMSSDHDFALVYCARTSPHHVLIDVTFRRTEFTNLYSFFSDTGYYHYYSVENSCNAFTKLIIVFLCSDRLDIHYCLRVYVVVIRCDHIEFEAVNELLSVSALSSCCLADVQCCSFDLGLVTKNYLIDLVVLTCHLSDYYSFALCLSCCCRSCCCWSCDCTAADSCRNLDVDVLALSDVQADVSACSRSCNCRSCCNRSCLCCFFSCRCFFCWCFICIVLINDVCCDRCERINSLCKL